MKNVWTVARRELQSYFSTPIAAIFLIIFLGLAGFLTFQQASFYEAGQADLRRFFTWHPWLYLFLVPALAMRLWAEERRSGTVELLLTLPISPGQAIVGKFLASWLFAGLALLLTFPMWWTVNFLGEPDNGAIFASYLGSFLMAGGFLAIGTLTSVLTKNQVIAFVLAVAACLLFLVVGHSDLIRKLADLGAPQAVLDLFASFSFLSNFEALSKGVIDLTSVVFFGSLIVLCLFLSRLSLERVAAS